MEIQFQVLPLPPLLALFVTPPASWKPHANILLPLRKMFLFLERDDSLQIDYPHYNADIE